MVDENGWVDLADAVRVLRAQVTRAMVQGDGEQVRFELGPVELELAVDMRQEIAGEAGVRFGVAVSGKGSESAGVSHRVKLVLSPKDVDGQAPLLSSPPEAIPPR